MIQFRRWALWRRVQYGAGFVATVVLLLAGVYGVYFYEPASCFDLLPNGDERGMDCGGSCVRICASDTLPPRIVWAKSFEITNLQYNATAYVENVNQEASTAELKYTFQFYNGERLIGERSGTTVLPPRSVYPIFEGRITTSEPITDTKLVLEPIEIWQPATLGREQFRSNNISLTGADSRPRLDVAIENLELTPARSVEVVATLFNANGDPVTSSQTFIETIDARSSRDIVFTWPNSIAKTVRSCIIPTDVLLGIDLSGSMNNDGGDPPQPVSDALIAATQFVKTLKKNDQAAIVTFATQAALVSPLVDSHDLTAAVVEKLQINPADETGFTNTNAALQLAQTELNSERHNNDARRVLVLLTDGLPTAPGQGNQIQADTIKTAQALSLDGVAVYAIGLGAGVDLNFITQLASGPQNAFVAPTTSDLEAIYTTITSSLCETGTARIDVIAKTPTNFAPLR
jgi:Mg-chelatase subunit ChlD